VTEKTKALQESESGPDVALLYGVHDNVGGLLGCTHKPLTRRGESLLLGHVQPTTKRRDSAPSPKRDSIDLQCSRNVGRPFASQQPL
jgi:hypothetical protein